MNSTRRLVRDELEELTGTQQGLARRERAIRRLALTNPTVAAAVGLVDNNGLTWLEAMECAVLELAASPPLSDRDDDGLALCCGELECTGHGGEA